MRSRRCGMRWAATEGARWNTKMIDLPQYVRARKVIARSSGGRNGARSDDNAKGESGPKDATTSTSPAGEEGADEEAFPRVHLGKYLEDLTPGLKIRHFLTRTVTEADNVFFTCLTLNPAPIHLDHELSRGNSSALGGAGADEEMTV